MTTENVKTPSAAVLFLRRRDTWIRWVLELKISPMARVVGVHLAMRMNAKDQESWPNVKTIAKSLQMSPRNTIRAIAEIENAGALTVHRKRGHGNYYTMRLPTDEPAG